MSQPRRLAALLALSGLVLGLVWACPFDVSLREYLRAAFWLPFSKRMPDFERPNVRRIDAPFAGMSGGGKATPLARLRDAYQSIADGQGIEAARAALEAARADPSLDAPQREEVDLLAAKLEIRSGDPQALAHAKVLLTAFLARARTPHYLSEARGWLAHVHYRLGEQTEAGRIYLEELNRDGSNLSRETLLTSLRMTYGYDGGPKLLQDLDQYFDTAERAAFAIQLVTNPREDRYPSRWDPEDLDGLTPAPPYARLTSLLEKHAHLFATARGASLLTQLGMRVALHAGDPAAALRLAARLPAGAASRREPDFLWMLGSARFLTRDFAGATGALIALAASPRASEGQRRAAAYGLCGAYRQTGDTVEQLRWALWLKSGSRGESPWDFTHSEVWDQTLYWAASGFDLGLLLDVEAPIPAIEEFLRKYPAAAGVRTVRYSLAVRLTREGRYREAADLYGSISAPIRAARLRRLATLDQESAQGPEARFRLAEFIAANPDRIYFNDLIWYRFQRYALTAEDDSRLTRAEREQQLALERRLKDQQEERWRAYAILRGVVREAGNTELGLRAARLALRCLRGISDRFGRTAELLAADRELSVWVQRPGTPLPPAP